MWIEFTSGNTLTAIDTDLRAAAARHQFGVLTVHDLQQTMKNKGVDFSHAVLVYEVCNPHQAKAVLEANPSVSTALPCRISVYTRGTATVLATLQPTALMTLFGNPELAPAAREAEETLVAMMKEAAGA
jgi:uncharacterized protein (DUF302 family)